MVLNIHNRTLSTSVSKAGVLIDRLASEHDKFWPRKNWPTMRFDRKLQQGAIGGHGPIRYFVDTYEQGRSITFIFTGPKGFVGKHGFYVDNMENGLVKIEHRIEMILRGFARFTWPIVFRPLHDALMEEALDNAESFINHSVVKLPNYSPWVRFLRWVLSRSRSSA